MAVTLKAFLGFCSMAIYCPLLVDAFAPSRQDLLSPRRINLRDGIETSSTLFYKDESSRPTQRRVLTIPVLGPIPRAKPLVVGEDYYVLNPTPLQWKTLEESIHTHRTYLKQQEEGVAGIEAAPLVAFMDEITSLAPIRGDQKNSKYATIAAVVGISSTTSQNTNGLDTSSNDGFMQSIMSVFQPDQNVLRPSESTIRLVGIGRAALSDFHSRLPSSYYEDQDNNGDGYKMLQRNDNPQTEDVETPILMAQFRLLSDIGARSAGFVHEFGRSGNSSPVHALAEMSSLSNRITSLHEDRKQLVRGLKAAQARLAVASQAAVLEDHDGLGQLSTGFQLQDTVQHEIESLLNEFPANSPENNMLSPQRPHTDSHARLMALENWGMGVSSASFAAIPGLTRALAEKLSPYYSPETQATEEHYYEVYSFMAVLSLSKFVAPTDLAWALKCTNTIERMQWVYEWMWSHKKLLREASEEVSSDLRDCGEECTDLW